MRRRLLGTAGALGAALAVAATASNGTPINPASASPLTLSVIGDVPYSEAQLAAFPASVDAINRDPKVDLVVHLGDIKSGGTRCDDAYYTTISGSSRASRTRSSTRPATTSGRTATDRPTARTTHSSVCRSCVRSSSPTPA